jgi:hypothetical protein
MADFKAEPILPIADNKVAANVIGEVIDYGMGVTFTRMEERTVLRKIDLAVLPMVQSLINATGIMPTLAYVLSDLRRLLLTVP